MGKVDLILANFTITDERKEEVDFALPYMNVALGGRITGQSCDQESG